MTNIKIIKPNNTELESINIEKNLIIVGANGSGKTRLGFRIAQINQPTKRISAQRYLQFSEVVQKKDYDTANGELENMSRQGSPVPPQNDFQQLLSLLFSEEAVRNENLVKDLDARGTIAKEEKIKSAKEKVIEVWDLVLPYRSLKLERDRVRADAFSGPEMSDGERCCLHLISHVLLAPENCILIIDEPELHLHKALMVRLWNKLEEYRSDCIFIYITHDLDFAVSKPSTDLIWVKSYENNVWNWEKLNSNETIPENLFLEMLGSRQPILFIEGDKGSIDIKIYQAFYENFTVIPCASCEKVIEAVKGLKTHSSLHNKKICGIIDRDFRPEEQLDSLKNDGIYSIALHEVENIFLVPEIIEMVCEHMGEQNKQSKKNEVIEEIRINYGKNQEETRFSSSKSQLYRHLMEEFKNIKNEGDYDNFKENILSKLEQLETREKINFPGENADIVDILKVYPHKNLANTVQYKLGLAGKDRYQNLVLSFLTDARKRNALLQVLEPYLPQID